MSFNSADIAHIRQDYTFAALDESVTGEDPILFFQKWFGEALESKISEVNAMTLATVDSSNQPHARIVLLKGLNDGAFSFFTNYDSSKGNDIANNSKVSLLFFWKELERQVRISGIAVKLSAAENDEYFHSRPEGSKIGAWASPQSRKIEGRHIIEQNVLHFEQKFSGVAMQRPEHWGGYKVVPHTIEFWQGRASRLHDRIQFTIQQDGNWTRCRLAP